LKNSIKRDKQESLQETKEDAKEGEIERKKVNSINIIFLIFFIYKHSEQKLTRLDYFGIKFDDNISEQSC